MTEIFLSCALGGYLLGSIPFGLVLCYMAGLGDIRKIGSGNIGATNVLRTGRKGLALLTVLLDASKAGFAAWLAGKLAPHNEIMFLGILTHVNNLAALTAGVAAVLGHNFPVWLKFKGGKGVASAFGFILVMNPLLAGLVLGTWLLFAFCFRYSSLSALAAATATPIYAYFLDSEINALFFSAIAVLVIVRHHANIVRLIKGSESKISFKKKDKNG
ncbi:MAG: glycerol-3-phosphate 1-O-acyltransferase PlsY [Alphaproteobacteria bacterium]|nr:glycerol-3-phosphate 1-O-acyltransferase PlsY [Alphaproteobacteria bacterium]